MRYFLTLAATLWAASADIVAQESLPPGTKLAKIDVFPAKIDLAHPFDYRQLLLTGTLDNGAKLDVTRMATFEVPEKLAKISTAGQVRPVGDGKGAVTFNVLGQKGSIPVAVANQKKKYDVSFVQDVMPVLSRMGCNAGTCHGGAQGKNGFQLSLRGYDPLFDHRALTDDIGGRRFNRAAPDRSLMLLKTTGGVPHVGGVLTQPGEPYYELLRTWIGEGVALDMKAPRVVKIEVAPLSTILPLPGFRQQIVVQATYSNGKTRDVSAEAFLESSNTEVATVDRQGIVTAVRRGETAILARYEGNYAAAGVIVMGDRSAFAWKETPEFNYIDTLVYEKLKAMKILPSELCTDSDFIRRLYLDLTGLPPEPEAVKKFLADPRESKAKREELIDQLVGSNDYVEHWTNKWADLLQVNRKFLGEPGAAAFRKWIQNAIDKNMPYDQFAHKLLTASGSNVDNPPAAYFKILRDPELAMENTTHLFLCIRFNCNKCHDHPFERWNQNQYYEMSSFFAQIDRKEDPKFKGQKTTGTAVRGALPLVEVIADAKSGEVTHLRTGEPAKPIFPFQHASMPNAKDSRRQQLAEWITSKDNPYFAKSYINRVWSYLLGTGLIEPIDDIRAGNPPTNPQLLDRLTQEFIQSGFDVRHMIKTICRSRTYQHSLIPNEWNKDDDVNYSHALARRLPAEVLYDAIHRAAGLKAKLPGLPEGSRAAQLLDANVPVPGGFLELFGRPPRESACECERTNAMMLAPVLNLVNGPVLNDAVKDPRNRIAKILAETKDDAKVVEELYFAILSRAPTKAELAKALAAFEGNDEEFKELNKERTAREAALALYEKKIPDIVAKFEKEAQRSPIWVNVEPESVKSQGGAALAVEKDLSILASGKNPSPDTYTITVASKMANITGVRLEVLADDKLPAKGPGRAPNGNFVLSEFKVDYTPLKSKEKEKPKQVKLTRPQATFSQDGFAISNTVDNNPATGWAISPQFGRNQLAVFEAQTKFGDKEGSRITFTLSHQATNQEHNLGKFRIALTTVNAPILLKGATPESITKILDLPKGERTPKQQEELVQYVRSIDFELGKLQRALNEITLPPSPRAMGAQDLAWALMNSPAFLFNH